MQARFNAGGVEVKKSLAARKANEGRVVWKQRPEFAGGATTKTRHMHDDLREMGRQYAEATAKAKTQGIPLPPQRSQSTPTGGAQQRSSSNQSNADGGPPAQPIAPSYAPKSTSAP